LQEQSSRMHLAVQALLFCRQCTPLPPIQSWCLQQNIRMLIIRNNLYSYIALISWTLSAYMFFNQLKHIYSLFIHTQRHSHCNHFGADTRFFMHTLTHSHTVRWQRFFSNLLNALLGGERLNHYTTKPSCWQCLQPKTICHSALPHHILCTYVIPQKTKFYSE
jgi:hypothetical protein